MIEVIFKAIFCTVAWVMMWKIATAEEMILEKVGKWGEQMAEKYKIFNGLIVCEWCLPNIHGILFVWPLMILSGIIEWEWKLLFIYPFVLGGSCFLSGMLWGAYLRGNAKHEYYEKASAYYDKAETEKHFDLQDRKVNFYKKKNNNGD